MYISKQELMKLVKDHQIRGCSQFSKAELITALKSKGIISDDIDECCKDPKRYKFIKGVRHGKKTVQVRDLETGETKSYPSIYSCAKAFKVNPGTIVFFNGRLYDDNYEINILENKD